MNKIKINEINFNDIDREKFAIVVTGAGGDLNDWVKGLSEDLINNNLINEEDKSKDIFTEAYKITGNVKGEDGRIDLLLIFNSNIKINIGRLAMWRLRRSSIKWHDDFLDNYRHDYEE